MARRKLEIKATQDQLDNLKKSLGIGAPLPIALQKVGISMQTYYYWVAIASIVKAAKIEEELDEVEKLAQSGVSVNEIKELTESISKSRKTGVGVYIEPSAESVLQYKTSRKFRKFADQCYDIINACDMARGDFATAQLARISQSTHDKKINPSGAMWWLERNLPDFFAKPSDKAKDQEGSGEVGEIPSIKVEFVDPNTPDQKQRLADMEAEILSEQKGGKA